MVGLRTYQHPGSGIPNCLHCCQIVVGSYTVKLNLESPNIIQVIKFRRMRWARHVACMGDRRGAQRVLVGRCEGKRALGRYRCRCEDNIKMYLHEVRWGGMDWIYLAQDRDRRWALVNAVMNFRVP